jgi:hypothetical protein
MNSADYLFDAAMTVSLESYAYIEIRQQVERRQSTEQVPALVAIDAAKYDIASTDSLHSLPRGERRANAENARSKSHSLDGVPQDLDLQTACGGISRGCMQDSVKIARLNYIRID